MRNFMARVSLLMGCCVLVSTAGVAQTSTPTPTKAKSQQPRLTLKNTIISSTNSTQPALPKGLTASAPAFPTTGIPFNPPAATTAVGGSGTGTGTGTITGTITNLAEFQRQWAEIILLSDYIANLLGVQFNSPIEEAFFVLSVAKLYFASQQSQYRQRRSFSTGSVSSSSTTNSGALSRVPSNTSTVAPITPTATKSRKLTIANPIISSTPKK